MPNLSKEEIDTFKFYEDGKQRRHNLLFAVNGGAFTIASLMVKGDLPSQVGALSVPVLAYGMAIFTFLMGVDIIAFGWKMTNGFTWPGIFVISALTLLMIAGWLFAACRC